MTFFEAGARTSAVLSIVFILHMTQMTMTLACCRLYSYNPDSIGRKRDGYTSCCLADPTRFALSRRRRMVRKPCC